MASSSLMASISTGAASTSTPCSSTSSSTLWPEGNKNKRPAARKPKRNSFACLVCSKTFPSQQAMAGHCSAHSRAGARRITTRHTNQLPAAPVVAGPSTPPPRHHKRPNDATHDRRPQVQGSSTNLKPPVAIRYAPNVPNPRPISNQMMVRLPYLEQQYGRNRVPPPTDISIQPAVFRPTQVHSLPAAQLGWGACLPFYSVPQCSVKGAAASDVCWTTKPGHNPVDLTLRLGCGGNHAQKRTLPLIESLMVRSGQQGDDRKGKRALVMDGGDQGCSQGRT